MDGHKSNDEAEAAPQNTSVADTTMDSAVHNGSQGSSAAVEATQSNDSQQEVSTTSTAAESPGADSIEASIPKEGNGNTRGNGNPRGRGRGRGGFRGSPRQYNNARPPFRRGGSEGSVGYRRNELLEVIRMQHMKVVIYTSSSDLTSDERQAGIKAARHAFDSAMEEWTKLGLAAAAAAEVAAQSAINAAAAATDAPTYGETAPPSPEAAEA